MVVVLVMAMVVLLVVAVVEVVVVAIVNVKDVAVEVEVIVVEDTVKDPTKIHGMVDRNIKSKRSFHGTFLAYLVTRM